MPSYTTISLRMQDEIAIVEVLARRIYLHTVEEFRDELQQVLSSTAGPVLIDLGKVSVMNSAGLGVLIATQDQLQKNNRRLVVVNLQPLMQEIFGRMRLETLIAIADTQAEGLRKLQDGNDGQ